MRALIILGSLLIGHAQMVESAAAPEASNKKLSPADDTKSAPSWGPGAETGLAALLHNSFPGDPAQEWLMHERVRT